MPAHDNLTHRQLRLLVDALMYRATPEMRRALMTEVPDAYNAYCGKNIVTVHYTDTGDPVTPPPITDDELAALRAKLIAD